MLTFRFSGTCGQMTEPEVLTSGMAGKKLLLEFSRDWEDLTKTVVFSNGSVAVDVVYSGGPVTIPARVLEKPLKRLSVGVYGVSSDGKLVIPTIRAEGPEILPGVEPAGVRGEDPELPIWAQLLGLMGSLEDLETETRENLVAAINEAASSGGSGTGGENGVTFIPAVSEDGILTWTNDGGRENPGPVDLTGPAGADGTDGADGQDGQDGKSAYAYAQEGGYSGTETEFSEKLARELPETLPNPHPLTFTGAVEAVYDGSGAVSVTIPAGGSSGGSGSSAWELIYNLEVAEELSSLDDKTIDGNRDEYLLTMLVPQVETQIGMGNNNFFGQRCIFAKNAYAMTTGAMLHTTYMKKISAEEALFITDSAEKSEGFHDLWNRTRASKIAYGGLNANFGLFIQNVIPAGTHIKIYAR